MDSEQSAASATQDRQPSVKGKVVQHPDPLENIKVTKDFLMPADGASSSAVNSKFFHSRLGNNTLQQMID